MIFKNEKKFTEYYLPKRTENEVNLRKTRSVSTTLVQCVHIKEISCHIEQIKLNETIYETKSMIKYLR